MHVWNYLSLHHGTRAATALATAAVAAMVAGCGPASAPGGGCSTESRPGLAIAAGARNNAPTPAITVEVDKVIEWAMDERKAVTVIRVDGRPSIACSFTFQPIAKNDPAKVKERNDFRNTVRQVVTGVRAREPEADVLGALGMAAAAAAPGGKVVLIDSGLPTVAPLDLRKDLINADPQAIADELRRNNHVPDLKDIEVILSGIGYTAAPQEPVDEARRVRLIKMWTAIVVAGGGRPIVASAPNTSPSVPNVPAVGTIAIPRDTITLGCDTLSVLSDDGAVGFIPDTANFIRPDAATDTLRQFSDWLKKNPRARIELVGNVAHYGTDLGDGGLARQRALRVRQELITLGVAESQVTARGDGWGPFPDKTAKPSKEHDQLNRRVVATIVC